MPPTTARETLLRVLALIEKGWTRGRDKRMRGDRACYCLSGALGASGAERETRNAAIGFMECAIGNLNNGGIVLWNDKPKRRKSDVVAMLKHAINLASA